MTSQYYRDDADYGGPQQPATNQPQRENNPQRNIPHRHQPITLNQPRPPPNLGRYPARAQPQRATQLAEYTMSANFSNDAPFDDLAYYDQSSQWTQNPRRQTSARDQRPRRTDSSNTNIPPPRSRPDAPIHPARSQSRNPPPPNRQLVFPAQASQPHHGIMGDVRGPPPQQRLPTPPSSGASRLPRPTPSPHPSQAMPSPAPVYLERRGSGSLGPPPSARKGPASMNPPVNLPWTIKEESDSMRGSAKSAGTPGVEKTQIISFAPRSSTPPPLPPPASPPPQPQALPGAFPEPQSSQDRLTEKTSGESSEYVSAQERLNGNGNGNASHSRSGSGNGNSSGYDGNSSGNDSGNGYGARAPKSWQTSSMAPFQQIPPARQASLGQKGKPKLALLKYSETQDIGRAPSLREPVSALHPSEDDASMGAYDQVSSQDEDNNPPMSDSVRPSAFLSTRTVGRVSPNSADRPSPPNGPRVSPANMTLSSGTGLMDASSDEDDAGPAQKSSSERAPVSPIDDQAAYRPRASSPVTQVLDPRVNVILGGLEKGGALSSTEAAALKKPMTGMSERSGKRRPPRLDIDMVRQAEARGSLTSLSDLIKRATRLATNLDNGRTASRLNFDFDDASYPDGGENVRPGMLLNRRSGASLSDMLASFPPPKAKPSGPVEEKSNPRLDGDGGGGGGERGERRRCCGLPLWAFILIMVLLILLVAAAIIVPVVLVVVPKHQNHDSRSVSSCQNTTTCANGGFAVSATNETCQCICAAGFTGSDCKMMVNGCTTVVLNPTRTIVIGTAIPPVVRSALNFDIPLEGDDIYSLLSRTNLTCNAENALVTFNGQSTRRLKRSRARLPRGIERSTTPSSFLPTGTTTSQTQTPTTSTSTSANLVPATAVAFARVAVLLVLQVSAQLNDANAAQNGFLNFFSGEPDGVFINPRNISLSNNFTANIVDNIIFLPNGTQVGGT